ncbi:MAG: hypothetical protein GY827_12325 [Cytophagales bacterium]|nr:hypothetical protein [Cytophagales bacterium]
MKGFLFTPYIPESDEKAGFENFKKVFFEILNYTAGDVTDALDLLTQVDNRYGLSNAAYGVGDFIQDLKEQGYLSDKTGKGEFEITAKSEQTIRKSALEEIFGKLQKGNKGNHRTNQTGIGDEKTSEFRPFEYGDLSDQIDFNRSIRNAQINHGIDSFQLTHDDLEIEEKSHKSGIATVVMIDISHSMILYGEDRITPAKKVAMALSELISTKYPGDTVDYVVFGNDAWPITKKELPYLKVGPYHTNTYAGLELALNILKKKKTPNKQVVMITDGKPTCLKIGSKYYKNSFGLDRKVINKTMQMAAQFRKLGIPITTFMIASDPYLQQFVREFTETNNGRAYYSSLDNLGEYVFEDFIKNRKKTLR